MIRAVIDTNVLASSLIQPKGHSGAIIQALLTRRAFRLVTSQDLLEEISRCLFYPRVRKRIALTDEAVRQWVAALALVGDVVAQPPKLDVVPDDPDDNIVVAAALEGRANYIVTGDPDLLDLKRYENIDIVRPSAFSKILHSSNEAPGVPKV